MKNIGIYIRLIKWILILLLTLFYQGCAEKTPKLETKVKPLFVLCGPNCTCVDNDNIIIPLVNYYYKKP